MKVNCPSCKRAYKVDDTRVQSEGLSMRCPQCGSSFVVGATGVVVKDPSSGSIPSEPRRENPSVQPKRPSNSVRVSGAAAPEQDEFGSGVFGLEETPVIVEPSSSARLDETRRPDLGGGKPLAPRDSWGFELPPYASAGNVDLPVAKVDPFDDLGLALSNREPTLEIGAIGGDEDSVDLPAPVDMAIRQTRLAPVGKKPVAAPVLPELSDDPFGEIDLGDTAPRPKLHVAPAPPPVPPPVPPAQAAPRPVALDSAPPVRLSSDESDFGDLRLSGYSLKPPAPPPSAAPERVSTPSSRDRAEFGFGSGLSVPLPPLGSSIDRGGALPEVPAPPPPTIKEIKLASVPPLSGAPGGVGFGEFDFGGGGGPSSPGEFDIDNPAKHAAAGPSIPPGKRSPADSTHEFKGIPTNRAAEDSRGKGRVGGPSEERLELATDPHERLADKGMIVDEAVVGKAAGKPGKDFAGRRRWERQSRKFKLAVLGALVVMIAAGVGLSWTPLGPFGVTAIVKLLPNTAVSKIRAATVSVVTEALQKDDYRNCQSASDELKLAMQEFSDDEDLRLLGVFLLSYEEARFGLDKSRAAEASNLLRSINLEESESPWAPLARAARELRSGNANLSALTAAMPSQKGHVLSLQAMASLASHKAAEALALSRQLDALEKSPRARFLVARALLESGKTTEATSALEQLFADTPKHTDSGALLAKVLLEVRPLPRDRILALVSDVMPRSRPMVAAQARAVLAKLHLLSRHLSDAKGEVDHALTAHPSEPLALVVRGDIALQEDDLVLAATMYNRALAAAPGDLSASLGNAEVKLREGRLTEAKDKAQALVGAYPASSRAHYVMGLALEATDAGATAGAELLKAIELDPASLDAYLALAQLHMKLKQDNEAMAILDKAAAVLPGNPIIARTLAGAHASRGDYAAAIVELNKAVELQPEDPQTYYLMAQMYRRMKAFSDARLALAEVEKRAPTFPGLALEAGLVSEQEGKLDEALARYEKALLASPEDANAKVRVGAVAHLLGDNAKAEQLLAQAVAALPSSAEANYYLGEVYRVTQRPSEAMRLLLVAKDIDKTNGLYFLRYAMSLMDLGDHLGAIRALEQAQALAPELGEINLRFAEIRLIQGSARDAIESAETALKQQPSLLEAHIVLGKAYEELSDSKQSRQHYRAAASALPDNAEVHYLLGLSELKVSGERASLGPLSRAVELVDKAASKPDWLPEALFRRGVALAASGQKSAAIDSLKRYFEVAPENHIDRAEVQGTLDRLQAY